MSDFEVEVMEEQLPLPQMELSDYSQVLFPNILENYEVGKDLECTYSIKGSLTPTKYDWVGLYRVGWSSTSDYQTYMYAPMPTSDEGLHYNTQTFTFNASYLPQDDGEFYQFCYVAGSGKVRGASLPFQFISAASASEQLVEIEDIESDMMVIKSRTDVLEEELQIALEDGKSIKTAYGFLERERDVLLEKLTEMEAECDQVREQRDATQQELTLTEEKVAQFNEESVEIHAYIKKLQHQLATVEEEKEVLEKSMDEHRQYMLGLEAKIKELHNAKDALMGRTHSLEEEIKMYKANFSSSEQKRLADKVVIADLTKELDEQKERADALCKEQDRLELKVANCQASEERGMAFNNKLSAKLQNTEDQLMASEQSRAIQVAEMENLQQAYDKVSRDMEASKMETDSCKQSIQQLESCLQELNERNSILVGEYQLLMEQESEAGTLHQKLQEAEERCNAVKSEAKEQLEGAMHTLRVAQDNLKLRLAKKQAENQVMKKTVEDLVAQQKKCEERESDLRREVEELKEHLQMGQDSYKEKHVECQNLKREIKKLRAPKRPTESISSSGKSSNGRLGKGVCNKELWDHYLKESRLGDQLTNVLIDTVVNPAGASKRKHEEVSKASADVQKQYEALKEKDAALQHNEEKYYEALRHGNKSDRTDWQNQWSCYYQEDELRPEHEVSFLPRDETVKPVEPVDPLKQELWNRNAALHEKNDFLTQENAALRHDYDEVCVKMSQQAETEKTLREEVQRLTHIIHGQKLQEEEPACSCTGMVGAPVEPLPLRFGSPSALQPRAHYLASLSRTAYVQPNSAEVIPQVAEVAEAAATYVQLTSAEVIPQVAEVAEAAATDVQPNSAEVIPQVAEVAEAAATDVQPTSAQVIPQLAEVAEMSKMYEEDIKRMTLEDDLISAVAGEDISQYQEQRRPSPALPQCPECPLIFEAETTEHMFVEHLQSHYGIACPVCSEMFPSANARDSELYQKHVQEHFD